MIDEIRRHGDVAGEEVFIQAARLRVRRGVVCVRLLLPAGGQEQREGQRGSEAALKMFFHMEFSFPMFAAQSAAIWMVT